MKPVFSTGAVMRGAIVCAAVLAGAAEAAEKAPPKFTRKPTAKRVGEKVKVEFAVSRRTDVAVYVLDAKGKRP